MSEGARLAHDYAAIVNAMVSVAKVHGLEDWGGDHGLACYQLLETAISEAEVWDVPLAEIGLEGFGTNDVLNPRKKPRHLAADDQQNEQRNQQTADWQNYWSIIYNMVYVAKERGLENPGSGYALACHQILAAAISQASSLKVPLADIELEGFDTDQFLHAPNRETA
jgi:hypothetical protein